MGLQAYGICRGCAELYPASRGCPICDGDLGAAEQMQTLRIAHVVGASGDASASPLRPRRVRPGRSALFAAFGISLFVGSIVFAVLQV